MKIHFNQQIFEGRQILLDTLLTQGVSLNNGDGKHS